MVEYFKNKSLEHNKINYNKTYIVFDKNEFEKTEKREVCTIYGLYTLSINTLNISKLSENKRRKYFGGSSYKGINNVEEIPTLLLGKLVKNEKSETEDFFKVVFNLVYEQLKVLDEVASLNYLSLDCKPELYEKVYKKYGFKVIDTGKTKEHDEYISCGMNLLKDKMK